MVLRVCGEDDKGKGKGKERLEEFEDGQDEGPVIRRMKVWSVRQEIEKARGKEGQPGSLQEEKPLWDLIQKGFEGELACRAFLCSFDD